MNLKYEYLMVRPQSSRLKLCCEYVVLQVGKISVVDALTTERVSFAVMSIYFSGKSSIFGRMKKAIP